MMKNLILWNVASICEKFKLFPNEFTSIDKNSLCIRPLPSLKNKFNIHDDEKLDIMERSITSMLIAKAMIEIPFENVDFEFYKNLHKYVFGDIYEWAGTIRTVDMSKKGTRFCPADKIEERGQRIFQKIINLNFLGNIKEDEFIFQYSAVFITIILQRI